MTDMANLKKDVNCIKSISPKTLLNGVKFSCGANFTDIIYPYLWKYFKALSF